MPNSARFHIAQYILYMSSKCPLGQLLTARDFTEHRSAPALGGEVFCDQNHLVLDLDHTLISSFEFGESPVQRRPSENLVMPILLDEYKDEVGLPQMYHATISNVVVLIKLRPYVRSFIRSAAEMGLTLHVYTKGRRAYMSEVIKLIDPDGLIKGRRISRDDEPGDIKESQKDISLIDPRRTQDRSYIVLDDSPFVWASCSSLVEIITAARYTFSDIFVTFLRSMERMGDRTSVYPRDSDCFLEELVRNFLTRFLPATIAPPVSNLLDISGGTTAGDEDETFTPVNVWNSKTESKATGKICTSISESSAVVIKVTRSRFV